MIQNPFKDWNRDFKLLAVAIYANGIYFGIRLTLYNNFIVDRLGIEPHQLGYIESLREVPGFLNVLFIALMIRLPPQIVGGISLVVMGMGIGAFAELTTITQLTLFSLVGSIGFHCWIPTQQALSLEYSPPGEKGRWLGQLRSVSSAGWLLTVGFCIVAYDFLQYEGLFLLAGAAAALGGLAIMFASRPSRPETEKGFVLKRRYWVYYALNVLQGVRRQMFITFAVFALVKIHGMPVKTTMMLVLINQVLIMLSSPKIGRMLDRYGERRMLSVSYFCLTLIFTGYAVITDRPILYVLFCLDNLVFFGPMAMTTYLNKIATKEDLRPTLSMGVTMNHVAAVIGPVIGGYVWEAYGYQVIFFSGAILAFVSLGLSQFVDPEGLLKKEAELEQAGHSA